jgi:hypothetical protein
MSSLRSFRGAILGILLSIAGILGMVAMTIAQEATPPNAPTQPEDIRQNNPGFLVRADVNRAVRSYREGDNLSVSVASEADAYVYVLYKQADGKVFQIYPNSRQPHNRVRARQAVQIPASDDLFRWAVGPPFGKEVLKVLASKEPLDELSDPAFREKLFNPVPQKVLKGIELELGKKEAVWAEDCVEIATYAANDTPQQAGVRRVGLFIGLGKYDHIVQTVTRPDGEKAEIYRPGHRDARLLAGVLQEVGQLHKARIVTNEEATRSGVEEAITQWLPYVSRPGDTVIVYFSGYAVPVSQGQSGGGGDRGVVLALYDFITPDIMRKLQEQRNSQKITRAHSQQLTKAEQLASSSGNQAVLRQWGIAEDLFAHWLQMLSGRQVIVILDAPYASAFAPAASAPPGPSLPPHGPLANGVSRLQSLGQQDVALLGACASQRFDVERDPHGLSLMTELLIQSIHRTTGPLSLEDAHREVAKNMEARLAEINQRLRAAGKDPVAAYQPYMVNTSNRPVLLKP